MLGEPVAVVHLLKSPLKSSKNSKVAVPSLAEFIAGFPNFLNERRLERLSGEGHLWKGSDSGLTLYFFFSDFP